MEFRIFALLLVIVAVESQLHIKIPCDEPDRCQITLNPSIIHNCLNGYCMCYNSDARSYRFCDQYDLMLEARRVVEPLVGRTCAEDEDCGLKNGFCNMVKSLCDCNSNYVPSKDNTKCLKVATGLRDHCVDDKQCLTRVENSSCENGECRCADGYHQIKDRCEKNVGYRENCLFNRQCEHITGAKCFEQTDKSRLCDCHQGTVINIDYRRCLPVITELNEECEESVQCTARLDAADCIDKQCQCRHGYHFVEKRRICLINKAYGDECFKDGEGCFQLAYPNDTNALYCSDENVCNCKNDYNVVDGLCHYSGAHQTVFYSSIFLMMASFVIHIM